jgi:RNA polymerase sigma-70 factor (ECF subfamily)
MSPGGNTTAYVRAARAGDADAIGRVVERFTPWLLAQARFRLRGRLAALAGPEDLVQDTWLIALRRLPELRMRGERLTPVLVRFLAMTLRRRLRDLLERELTGQRTLARLAASASLHSTVTQACSQAGVHERAELVWRTMRSLSERDQALIVLRGLEGTSFVDIGLLLGIGADAAAAAWVRARDRLREQLDPVLHDDLAE